MNWTHITKKELGKIPNIKTDLGLMRLFKKKDKHGNSIDYDFFFFKGFLYSIENCGWDYGSSYVSLDSNLTISTDIYFVDNKRLFKDCKIDETMSWRNDITFYTMNKDYKY